MTTSDPRPWARVYPNGDAFAARFTDALSLLRHAVAQNPDGAALHYFDGTLSYGELDALSDAFAAHLAREAVQAGDRVALFMQNTPQFVVCLVRAWKHGCTGVSVNPMSRGRELRLLLADSGARVIVAQRDLYAEVACEVLADFPGVHAITFNPREWQTRNDPRVFDREDTGVPEGTTDLQAVVQPGTGRVTARGAEAADPAMIVYTSGTTGVPKGAVVSHGNLAFNADVWRAFCGLRDGGPILAVAPLFHITGLVGHMAAAFACAAPMILAMRFHPEVVAEAAEEHRAEFAVGAITAFIAMLASPRVTPQQLRTIRLVCSGGAPVPAAVAAEFEQKFGLPVHCGYGLTETTSIAVAVPPGRRAPIDANGALAVGVPVFATDCHIAGDRGERLGPGELGEIMLRGPQVVSGYWKRPQETAEAFLDGYLRTGDVGYMDAEGWLYIVDRKKDMIIASGYKVWPKEVEEVLYTHAAIREAAVIGIPDAYRGETVKAVVSLKPGHDLNEAELEAFCRERLAAYKVPRVVQVLPELPKTLTGKILRRELR